MEAEATTQPRIPASLELFPNEIILHILYFLPPEDNLLCFQLLSKRLNDLANKPFLWRHHCSNAFKYWNPDHEFQRKLEGPVSDVDWKRLFILRKQRNARIAHLFDGILATKFGRLRKFEQICHLGYDAKDFLLDQCHVDDSVEDVLARRYHANSILDSIHREVAIKEWKSFSRDIEVNNGHDTVQTAGGRRLNTTVERCLAAFDMFILHDQPGDVDEASSAPPLPSLPFVSYCPLPRSIHGRISQMLDNLAAQFRRLHPDFDDLSTRDKALTLNLWLRSQKLLGMDSPGRNYRRLRNCFIGQALRYSPHQSLPLVSSAIYCSVADRLGFDARPCLFPSHVHTLVFPPSGVSLDGVPLQPVEESDEPPPHPEGMHLDPYGTDEEVPKSYLLALLANFGWQANADVFLSSAQPRNLIMRLAHNIRAAFTPDLSGPNQPEPYVPASDTSRPTSGSSVINRDAALLAFIWARLMLLPPNGLEWVDSLHRIFDRLTTSWIGDTWLIEKYICPLYDATGPHGQAWDNPRNLVETKRDQDTVKLRVRRRSETTANIRYKVGQVFRHRRLNFLGVITGWADDGPPVVPEDIMAPIVDTSEAGTVYYTCMRMDSLNQVKVLQHTILPVYDRAQIPDELFELAGLYFKRFDRKTCRFVSNIREEYPDD